MRGLATAVTRACRTGKSAGILLSALAGWLPTQSASADGERMLVFTKTVGYRHDSIPAAIAAIRTLAARHGIEIDHTEDAATFHRDKLSGFKVVAFVNTTGNVLDGEQQRAFEAFVAGGGGYLGVHSAADTGYDWPWYGDLVGARTSKIPRLLAPWARIARHPRHRALPLRPNRVLPWAM
jgi:cytochrome c